MADLSSSQSASPDATRDDQLKSALWLATGQLVDSTCMALRTNATPHFIASLTEMLWAQIGTAVVDAEAFAKHAGRKTITVEDVLLLARRNDGLEALVRGKVEAWRKTNGAGGTGTTTRR